MQLDPKARERGAGNFNGAIASEHLKKFRDAQGNEISRREFLVGSITAGVASGTGLGSYYFGYGASVDRPVRIGIIGTGDEGGVLIGALNPEFVEVVAIADIRPYNIYRAFHGDDSSPNALLARPGLIRRYGKAHTDKIKIFGHAPRKFNDGVVMGETYAQMLQDPEIEGVIVALPLHLHKEASIDAMEAGKHVLTEKLMAKTVGDCKAMARAAYKENKYLATGHQRHYSILYDNAVHLIKSGVLGRLHHIRAQWHRNNQPGRDSWQPPLPDQIAKKITDLTRKAADAKKSGDISRLREIEEHLVRFEYQVQDDILGQKNESLGHKSLAEIYGYQAKDGYTDANGKPYARSALEELIRWRLWERTGGGLMAELGSHQLDAASIFVSAMYEDGRKARPLRVAANGGRHIFPHDRDCEDHVYCNYEFPAPGYEHYDRRTHDNKIVVTYSSINGNDFGGYGEVVMGTNGTLILEKEQEVMLFGNASNYTEVKVSKTKSDDIVLDTTQSPGADAQIGDKGMRTGPVSRGYTEEIEHWAWCVRNPSPEHMPKCKPEVALADAVIALTTNIAIRQNRTIEFRDEWFEIDSAATPENDFGV